MDSLVKLVLCVVGGAILLVLTILGIYKRKEIKAYCGKERRLARKNARLLKIADRAEKFSAKCRQRANNVRASQVKTDYL